MKNIKKLHILFLLVITLTLSPFVFAKEINMYDQPKADAKVIAKVDLSLGFIPIFTPKEGGWMKIGDPRNGNVGWIKSSDLNTGSGPSVITFTQKMMGDGKTPYSYQTIQIGQPSKLNNEQMQAIQKMQMQQQAVQQSMEKAVQSLMNDMSTLYRHQMEIMHDFPMLIPVVVMPQSTPSSQAEKLKNQPAQPAPSKASTQPAATKQ